MKRFLELFDEMDRTTRTGEKTAAVVRYFKDAPPDDAAWAAFIFADNKLIRGISSTLLRELVAAQTSLPHWLIEECYSEVGDLSETISLLLPENTIDSPWSLHQLIETRILPMETLTRNEQAAMITETWQQLSHRERFLFHKLISTTFRVGVSRAMLIRALAEFSGVPGGVIDHRLRSSWKPSSAAFAALISPAGAATDPEQAYPFLLAHPWDAPLSELGELSQYFAEWKWDGIRAQLIRREGKCVIWSRGDELLTDAFPEIAQATCHLPLGCVLDGEIVAWDNDKPLPFLQLQTRINRKRVELSFWPEVPVTFIAYDLLERDGQDIRSLPLEQRRASLEQLIVPIASDCIRLSQLVPATSWEELEQLKTTARERNVEGLMLKRRDSIYATGRPRGLWWKAKIQPYTVDAVLIAAQPGSGRRAGLYTDYTFGVRHGTDLVPIAKAYSGLSADEIHEVDAWVRRHTLSRHGPVRVVEPEQVFELGFEAIQESTRHKSGLAVRFPRILRWRKDKRPGEVDQLSTLERLASGKHDPI